MKTLHPFIATLRGADGARATVQIMARDGESANSEALAAAAIRQRQTGLEWRVVRVESGGRVDP